MTSEYWFTLNQLGRTLRIAYSQLKELDSFDTKHPSIPLLKDVIREFRDDELEHLDIAVDNFSQRAPAHALLSSIVGGGCKIAIELCRRV